MIKSIMSLIFIISIPAIAFADSKFLLCEEDARAFDGDYQKISIVTNSSGTQDVYQSFAQGGIFPSGHPLSQPADNILIAEHLLCHKSLNGVDCYDQNNPSRLPVLKIQTVWISKEEYIKVTYDFKEIALFLKDSCH